MTLKSHLINFTRLGFIIGCIYMIFIFFNWIFWSEAVIDIRGTQVTGLASYGLLFLTPLIFSINGLLFGLISFLPYKVFERVFVRLTASK